MNDDGLGRLLHRRAQDEYIESCPFPSEIHGWINPEELKPRCELSRGSNAAFAIPLSEALQNIPPVNPLIEKLLERGSLAALIGDENTRKSFLALDLSLSVATGTPFHGLRVTRSKVLFVAGEGRSGLLRRAKAWLAYHKVDCPPDFFVNLTPADLLDRAGTERVRDFILQTLDAGEEFGLLTVDTLSRAMPGGKENASEDMSRLICNVDAIREATGAAVKLVHHTPLEVRNGMGKIRPRGHSSLPGAIDPTIACEFDPESEIATLTVIKQKDGEPIDPMRFNFLRMDLGEVDGFGNAMTTLVPRLTDEKPKKSKARLRGAQKTIIYVLERESPLLKAEALARAKEHGISRSGFYKALTTLLEYKLVELDGEFLRLL